jgi:small subunit ribosomal protein S2
MAQITMKQMLDAGVHFGHQTQRWNPKMKNYVYTDRGGIHIIDLQKSVVCAKNAADYVQEMAAGGGKLIFVGTKKQAQEPIKEAAVRSGAFFVTKRWLGGTLTNFQTVKSSIDRLKKIDQMREKGELEYFSKKEHARIQKEWQRLNDHLEGIRDMKEAPSCIFVVDLNKEHIAVAEAQRLGMAVVAIADTNTNPEKIQFPIPGNDDAIRSIKLFTNLIADAYLEGVKMYSDKIRSQSNKEADEAPEEARPQPAARRERPARGKEEKGPGPAVVKMARGRKLVAAGTAEDVEIAMELESGEKPVVADEAEAATESPKEITEK